MRLRSTVLVLLIMAMPSLAMADPAGKFDIRGLNPDDGSEYTGTVTVTRTGDTYRVVWKISGDQVVGTGIGMKLVGGRMVPGPASEDDTGMSVAYGSGDTYGTVVYFEQSDGSWHGVWAYDGWKRISTEDWIPKDRKTTAKTDTTVDTEIKSYDPPQKITAPLPTLASPKS